MTRGPRAVVDATRQKKLDGASDVGGLQAFGALDHIELYSLSLVQGLEAISLNSGIVHKHILTVRSLDEPKPLRIIEPLHSSLAAQLTTPPSVLAFHRPTGAFIHVQKQKPQERCLLLRLLLWDNPTEQRLPNVKQDSLRSTDCQALFPVMRAGRPVGAAPRIHACASLTGWGVSATV
jgi:hypothetical protein